MWQCRSVLCSRGSDGPWRYDKAADLSSVGINESLGLVSRDVFSRERCVAVDTIICTDYALHTRVIVINPRPRDRQGGAFYTSV